MTHLSRAAAATAAAALATGVLFVAAGPASTAAPAAAAASSAATVSRSIERVHLNADGSEQVAERKQFSVSVSATRDIRSRQPVQVKWSGAHPTGRVLADWNSTYATDQEYPVVILECRGVDDPSAPASRQLSRETCWSPYARFRQSYSPFPAWRVDRRAAAAERRVHVGVDKLPEGCAPRQSYVTERWLEFRAADGRVFNSNATCGRQPPEAATVEIVQQPTNTTFARTLPDGTGSTKFTVWNEDDNASLGCTDKVACSLVVIPILGISCDAAAKSLPTQDRPPADSVEQVDTECRRAGDYQAGASASGPPPALAVSGSLWWSPSNWANRASIPLAFAPSPTTCDAVGGKESVDFYGSELLNQATLQWQPALCARTANAPFKHIQVGEPQAKNLLSQGLVDSAFVADVPIDGYSQPVVNAPIAMTGFAVGYVIDDETQQSYRQLRLTARLLAKLLTMSYPGTTFVRDEYEALSGNPIDMSEDPEFIALNPGLRRLRGSEAAATVFTLSSDSDVTTALTSYIANDAEARAWLNGAADPWGMTVNPNYKKVDLPVENWPLLDAFEPREYYATGQNECLQQSPVPYLPLVAAPTTRLSSVSLALQFSLPNSTTTCQAAFAGQTSGLKLTTSGRQAPGRRFMLGITSLGDARRYALDTAALQTHVDPNAPAKFSSGAGREFVEASDEGLRNAARILRPDNDTMSWPIPYRRMATESSGAFAYPGATLVYAAIPTAGLTREKADGYATFLRYVAEAGQSPGQSNGQLPAGFLPLTAANGLGAQAAYTRAAASAVASQKGFVPPLTPAASSPTPTSTPTDTAGAGGAADGDSGTSGGDLGSGGGSSDSDAGSDVGAGAGNGIAPTPADPSGGASGSVNADGTPGSSGIPSSANPAPQTAGSLGLTAARSSWLAGAILPLITLAALVGGLLTPLLLAVNRFRP